MNDSGAAVIDPGAVTALFNDPDGPVADIILDATEKVGETAKIMAPVSKSGGSKFSPSGTLKAKTGANDELYVDELGLYGKVTAPSYPYSFVKGSTRNANRVDGMVKHYGLRQVDKPFLTDALYSASSLYDAPEL